MGTAEAEELIRRVNSDALSSIRVQCAALCGHVPALEALDELEGVYFSIGETADVFGLSPDEFREWIVQDCPGTEKEGFALPLVQRWAMENIWSIDTIPNCDLQSFTEGCTLAELANNLGVAKSTAAGWVKDGCKPWIGSGKTATYKTSHVLHWLYRRKRKPGEPANGDHDWFGQGPLISLLIGLFRLDSLSARQCAAVVARLNNDGVYADELTPHIDSAEAWLADPTPSRQTSLKNGQAALLKTMEEADDYRRKFPRVTDVTAQNLLKIMLEDNPLEALKVLADKSRRMSDPGPSIGPYDAEFSLLWRSCDTMIPLLLGHPALSVRPRLSGHRRWRIKVIEGTPSGGLYELEQDFWHEVWDWQTETRFYSGKSHFSGSLSGSDGGGWDGDYDGVQKLELSPDFKKLIIHFENGKHEAKELPAALMRR